MVSDSLSAGSLVPIDRGRWARLRRHAAIPLYRQGYALVVNSILTAALGVPYWLLAAREYTPSTVGRNAAAISAMMFLAGVAQLNLMSALLRFIPVSGRRSARLIVSSYLVAVAIAAGVSGAFLWGVARWAPALAFLASSPGFAIWFAVATMAWCVFNLQDSVLTALRSAALVPVANAATSLAKIGLLVALVGISPSFGIFASWTGALLVSLVPVNLVIFRRLLPRHGRDAPAELQPPTRRQLVRYVSADSVASMFWLAATTLMPVIVIAQVGAAANGYFSLAWTIALPLYAISASTGASLVVAAAREEGRLPAYTRKVTLQTACLVVPPAVTLAIAPRLVLGVFGDAYANHGAATLRLLALSAIPNVLMALYVSALRVRRRMLAVVAALGAQCGLVLVLSLVLLPRQGIAGVGLAWLISELAVVTMLLLFDPQLIWPRAERMHRRVALARLAGQVRRWWPDRRGAQRAARLTPGILANVVADGTTDTAGGWSLQRCLRTVTDRTVATVGPSGGPPRAVLKLAATPAAAGSLGREREVLTALRADARLGTWRRLLPTVLADGEVNGYHYAVEGFCPGTVASGLLAHAPAINAFQAAAASEIAVLHSATATQMTVDARVIARWVHQPILELRRLKPQATWAAALDRLSGELGATFAGRTLQVGWIHGDFAPSNILVTADASAVVGIVDWELAAPRDLASIDVTTLLLTTRAEAEHQELGHVVRGLLAGRRWTDHEGTLANGIQPGLADDQEDIRATVLLCWLRHAAANLTKSVRYGRHRIWIANNVDVVLDTLRCS